MASGVAPIDIPRFQMTSPTVASQVEREDGAFCAVRLVTPLSTISSGRHRHLDRRKPSTTPPSLSMTRRGSSRSIVPQQRSATVRCSILNPLSKMPSSLKKRYFRLVIDRRRIAAPAIRSWHCCPDRRPPDRRSFQIAVPLSTTMLKDWRRREKDTADGIIKAVTAAL